LGSAAATTTRATPEEAEAIFARLGLAGDFWRLS